MTKTNNNSSHNTKHRAPIYRRPWFWVAIALAVAALVTFLVLFLNREPAKEIQPEKDQSSESETEERIDPPKAENEKTVDHEEPVPEEKVTQYEGEDANDFGELTGVVSSAYVDGENLVIMATVDQYLNGTCALTLTGKNTGDTYESTSNLSADITTSYCEPFYVPVSSLTQDYYEIKIKLSGNDKTGYIKDGVEI